MSTLRVVFASMLLALVAPVVAFARVPSGGCQNDFEIQSCDKDGRINVGGGHFSHGGGGGGGSGPPTHSVLCGPETAKELLQYGDRDAEDDAMTCEQAIIDCQKETTDPEHPLLPMVVIVRKTWGWAYDGTPCVPTAPPHVTPRMVRQQAVRMIPTADVGLAPDDATLVNIQTIMWVDAPARQDLEPVTILGQQVEISIRLDHVDWTFGDGSGTSVPGPGKAYDEQGDPCRAVHCPDYFGHTYRSTGSVNVHATAYWTASFTVEGGPPVRIPGTVNGPTAQDPLTVKQARGVLTH